MLSEVADVCYKVSAVYDAATETGFVFDDPRIGVRWPIGRSEALLSKRDQTAAPYRDVFPEAT